MAAVRLRWGQEGFTLEKKDITSLLDALCERPFAGEGGEIPPAVEVFYQRAAEVVAQGDVLPPPNDSENVDAFAATLAAIYSGQETVAQRSAFERAAAESPDMRLEAESALAFLDAIGQTLEPAPAQLTQALTAASVEPAPKQSLWSAVTVLLTRRSSLRLATTFAVLLVAGGLSWSVYWQAGQAPQTAPGGLVPKTNAVASKVQSPAPVMQGEAKPPIALATSCEPGAAGTNAAATDKAVIAEHATPAAASPETKCGSDADHQLADKGAGAIANEREAMRRAEIARQAEMARIQAEIASRKAAADIPAAAARPAANIGDAAIAASPPAINYGSRFNASPPAAAVAAPPPAILYQQR
jgi:hypothetical protein